MLSGISVSILKRGGLEKTWITISMMDFKLIGNRLWFSFSDILVVLGAISGSCGECISGVSPLHLVNV